MSNPSPLRKIVPPPVVRQEMRVAVARRTNAQDKAERERAAGETR